MTRAAKGAFLLAAILGCIYAMADCLTDGPLEWPILMGPVIVAFIGLLCCARIQKTAVRRISMAAVWIVVCIVEVIIGSIHF